MPLAPRNGKSVIASVMDREPCTWPNRQWDASDPVASTELIFGDGHVFRTGAAGGPGTLEQQRASGGAQKSSQGPSQTDFHRVVQGSQGTMGIVTWITMRAELRPTIEHPLLLGADSVQDLIPFMYDVQHQLLGEQSFVLDRTAAALLASAQNIGRYRTIRDSLPRYLLLNNVAGFQRMPKERLEYQLHDIGSMADRHKLSLATSQGEIDARSLLDLATHPCGEIDWRSRTRGGCLSIFFLTTLDRTPVFIDAFAGLVREYGLDEGSFGVYVQPIIQNHACHVEFIAPFNPMSPGEVDVASKLEGAAVRKLAEKGAFFSRPYGSAGSMVFGQNQPSYDLLRKMKGIFDPHRVLNSGKWGL
jgi:FAD/FMN-containing dehydrogenase